MARRHRLLPPTHPKETASINKPSQSATACGQTKRKENINQLRFKFEFQIFPLFFKN
jgi:hypothetical protein